LGVGATVLGMAVLSVDLARRRWSDLGIVVLERRPMGADLGARAFCLNRGLPGSFQPDLAGGEGPLACEIIRWNDFGEVEAEKLAGRLNHLCAIRGIRILMLDGPQAWKSRLNGLRHARVSERQLNTAAKTGLPGMVKPVSYRPFAEFCIDVYDALCRRGWQRLATREEPGSLPERILVESYPYEAWRSLGLKPLPAKRRSSVSDLATAFGALRSMISFTVNCPPNHDQLQAIVGGLPGLALEERNSEGTRIVGQPPRREEGHWREGFIVLPVTPKKSPGLRWLD